MKKGVQGLLRLFPYVKTDYSGIGTLLPYCAEIGLRYPSHLTPMDAFMAD